MQLLSWIKIHWIYYVYHLSCFVTNELASTVIKGATTSYGRKENRLRLLFTRITRQDEEDDDEEEVSKSHKRFMDNAQTKYPSLSRVYHNEVPYPCLLFRLRYASYL